MFFSVIFCTGGFKMEYTVQSCVEVDRINDFSLN